MALELDARAAGLWGVGFLRVGDEVSMNKPATAVAFSPEFNPTYRTSALTFELQFRQYYQYSVVLRVPREKTRRPPIFWQEIPEKLYKYSFS